MYPDLSMNWTNVYSLCHVDGFNEPMEELKKYFNNALGEIKSLSKQIVSDQLEYEESVQDRGFHRIRKLQKKLT